MVFEFGIVQNTVNTPLSTSVTSINMQKGNTHTWHPMNLNVVFKQSRNFSCILITVYILLNMDGQKVTLLVMHDLSAAFDTTDHSILLETLGSGFGVGWTALRWSTSYLSQRTQQIQIKGTLSEKKQLTTGVPQGSCLGPVLFTIYVADLFQIIEKHLPEAQGYADDHQVYL